MEHIATLFEKVAPPGEFASGHSFTSGTGQATTLSLSPAGECCCVLCRPRWQTQGQAVSTGVPSAVGRPYHCPQVQVCTTQCVQLSGGTVLKLLTADIVIDKGPYPQGPKPGVSAPT